MKTKLKIKLDKLIRKHTRIKWLDRLGVNGFERHPYTWEDFKRNHPESKRWIKLIEELIK